MERDEIVRQIKNIIKSKADHVDREIVHNAYGSFITAFSTIKNGKGEGIGVVCVDINSREIDQFRRNILLIAFLVFIRDIPHLHGVHDLPVAPLHPAP